MNKPKICIIAPGHWITQDTRIIRSIQQASKRGHCIVALFEDDIKRFSSIKACNKELFLQHGEGVKYFTVARWRRKINPFSLRIYRYYVIWKIKYKVQKLKPDIIHIHESGSLGLYLAFVIKNALPNSKVIFDYHDWIPYEIYLILFKSKLMFNLFSPIFMTYYRFLAKKIDECICISNGQALWAKEKLRFKSTRVIQNLKKPQKRPFKDKENMHILLFLGGIMRHRNIHRALDSIIYAKDKGHKIKLNIVGNISDKNYFNDLIETSKKKNISDLIKYLGEFDSSTTFHFLESGSIGVLFSFSSNFDTGINEIASVNKFFHYLSLGIPVLLDKRYKNLVEIVDKYKVGDTFSTIEELTEKALSIWDSPNRWQEMSIRALEASHDLYNESTKFPWNLVYSKSYLDSIN